MRAGTQHHKILQKLHIAYPDGLMVKDFQSQNTWDWLFIGYEAWTRLADLIRKWYVKSEYIVYNDKKNKFKKFYITNLWISVLSSTK